MDLLREQTAAAQLAGTAVPTAPAAAAAAAGGEEIVSGEVEALMSPSEPVAEESSEGLLEGEKGRHRGMLEVRAQLVTLGWVVSVWASPPARHQRTG